MKGLMFGFVLVPSEIGSFAKFGVMVVIEGLQPTKCANMVF